jgi:cellulose synthase/poly-beta-1,6-N-acetylglucosamine synthase-like glycosyltransferase
MEPRVPLVSINIPCYHQVTAARRCIEAMLAQSFRDFEITLLDDGASDEYAGLVESLADARVRYQRNPARLGAMRNIFQSIAAGRGKYTLAFHEDDLAGVHYLATAVGILESDPTCGFVGGESREYVQPPPADARHAALAALSRAVRDTGRISAPDLPRRRADVRIDRIGARAP